MTEKSIFGISLFSFSMESNETPTSCVPPATYTSPTYTVFTPTVLASYGWDAGTNFGHVDTGPGTAAYHSEDGQEFSENIGFLGIDFSVASCTAHWSYDDDANTQPMAYDGYINC
ncbi:MAG TPA: hypothetical protein VFH54_07155 [Mycobacteriales bacterium]|nr:hypothetical protein [Mycobacteriales bacterium]